MEDRKHPYLENRSVIVKPIKAGNRWNNFMQNAERKASAEFIYPGISRSYSVKFTSTGYSKILDNEVTNPCPDILDANGKPTALTQEQYFSRILGIDLNPFLPKEKNAWASSKENSKTTVLIKDGFLKLNLNNPIDMFRYLILKSNKDRIAGSEEEFKNLKRATYEMIIVNESTADLDSMNDMDKEIIKMEFYKRITSEKQYMLDFFGAQGRTMDSALKTEVLKNNVATFFKNNPDKFYELAVDKNYDIKVLIHKAKLARAITQNVKGVFTIEVGDAQGTMLSDINEMIAFLNNPLNSGTKLAIKDKVDISNPVK